MTSVDFRGPSVGGSTEFSRSLHEIHLLYRPILDDPKDDLILDLAIQANYLSVTTTNHAK